VSSEVDAQVYQPLLNRLLHMLWSLLGLHVPVLVHTPFGQPGGGEGFQPPPPPHVGGVGGGVGGGGFAGSGLEEKSLVHAWLSPRSLAVPAGFGVPLVPGDGDLWALEDAFGTISTSQHVEYFELHLSVVPLPRLQYHMNVYLPGFA
jgi:hypothetical protein